MFPFCFFGCVSLGHAGQFVVQLFKQATTTFFLPTRWLHGTNRIFYTFLEPGKGLVLFENKLFTIIYTGIRTGKQIYTRCFSQLDQVV